MDGCAQRPHFQPAERFIVSGHSDRARTMANQVYDVRLLRHTESAAVEGDLQYQTTTIQIRLDEDHKKIILYT